MPCGRLLFDAKVAVSQASNKALHDYTKIFDGVPSQYDGKDAAVVAEPSRGNTKHPASGTRN